MNVFHEYDKMPRNYREIYYKVRFKSGKEMHSEVSKIVSKMAKKPYLVKEQREDLEALKALLEFKYNDEDIHENYDNFQKYFRKTKRTTNIEIRKKVNQLLRESHFTHAHNKEYVAKMKEMIHSLGEEVMEEVNEFVIAEKNRIKEYQQNASKRISIGGAINKELEVISPKIIKESKMKNNFFTNLTFDKDRIGFFITPDVGKDREIVTEYIKKANSSTLLNFEGLDDEDENYFITFTQKEDLAFMSFLLSMKFMQNPLEGVKLLGISLPTIIMRCKFNGMNIKEPEFYELNFNRFYQSIRTVTPLNRLQTNEDDDTVRFVINSLMDKTKIETELHLACYLHYNFLLPITNYLLNRQEYFKENNIIMPLDEYKKKRDDIYQRLIIEGKANVKWKNEIELFKLVKKHYSDAIFQYRARWLEYQSLDIYIPSLKIAIEYQGQQHYEPIEFFGGEEAFIYRKKMDQLKEKKCKDNGIKLILWKYKDVVSKANLNKKMKELLK
ncbi:hypothetical protein [Alkalihalobacillus sp. BA299]|uniref:hypothetical protein n=1 Tax=Alkalihalobacillus sp. BA299 TaxID=2815938 RepID=UPI001ADC6D25|nr:hypothetical protein [Alkalihalobacillus sp. BA299]